MSEEKHAEEAGAEAPKKSGKLKVIIIAVVAALIGAVGAGAAFFLLGEHPPQAENPDEQADEGGDAGGHEKKKKKKKKGEGGGGEHGAAAYMKLDNLTVNLSGGKDHFLAVSMELKLAEPEAQVHLTERLPEVKNLVLITLSAQTPDSLSSVDGKNALAQKLRDDLNALIDEDEETGVENVFFTQFIIQ